MTRLLRAVEGGDETAMGDLVSLIYSELHSMARRAMHHERPGHTLQTTALVHEAYLRLLGSSHPSFENRAHFFGAAAEAMRRALIDSARRRSAKKRGGEFERVTLGDVPVESNRGAIDLLALDGALSELEAADPRLSLVVKLRYFAGLTVPQTAEVLGISPATVKRDWLYAKAWLRDRIEGSAADDS